MCHWPSANVGDYLKDWKTQGICNRQKSLSSITHSFNQPRSAADKSCRLTRTCGSQHTTSWCCSLGHAKQNPSPVSQTLLGSHPFEDGNSPTTVRGTAQIRPLRCGIKSLCSWSQGKARLRRTYGSCLVLWDPATWELLFLWLEQSLPLSPVWSLSV